MTVICIHQGQRNTWQIPVCLLFEVQSQTLKRALPDTRGSEYASRASHFPVFPCPLFYLLTLYLWPPGGQDMFHHSCRGWLGPQTSEGSAATGERIIFVKWHRRGLDCSFLYPTPWKRKVQHQVLTSVDNLPLREEHRVRGTVLSSRAQRLSLMDKLQPHAGCPTKAGPYDPVQTGPLHQHPSIISLKAELGEGGASGACSGRNNRTVKSQIESPSAHRAAIIELKSSWQPCTQLGLTWLHTVKSWAQTAWLPRPNIALGKTFWRPFG